MKPNGIFCSFALSLLSISPATLATGPTPDSAVLERGRYLAVSSGCNDCHTPNYMETEGKVPEPQWLMGSPIGFQGPWGTSYPVNLRLYVQKLSQSEWLKRTSEPMRPPMPWFNLREMTETDRIALYEFIRSLGPVGEPAPAPVAPGVAVTTPYFDFEPKNLPKQALRQ